MNQMKRIAIGEIVIDGGTQVRASINEEVVANYAEQMQAGAVFPPVILFHDGNRYYMADGFHRALAAKRNGDVTIGADVRPGTKTDALWFALGANRENACPLTATDKRHAILLALKEWPDKSAHQIADQIGVSHMHVSRLREEAQVSHTLHLPSRVTGKDGKSYPASRPSAHASSAPASFTPPSVTARTRDPLDTVDAVAPPETDDADTPVLYHLKRYWRQAGKKERKAFRVWIDEHHD